MTVILGYDWTGTYAFILRNDAVAIALENSSIYDSDIANKYTVLQSLFWTRDRKNYASITSNW